MQTVEERFGNLVRYHLQLNEMTQEELGRRVGVTQRSISTYIQAKQQPSLGIIDRICKELKIDVNEVFGVTGVTDGMLTKNELKLIEKYREVALKDDEKFRKFESIIELLKHLD